VVLGVDVGGTKVAVAAVDGVIPTHAAEHPTVLSSADALLDGVEHVVREVMRSAGEPEAIGVGVPSQIDFATGTVVTSVNIPLTGLSLRDELGDRFGAFVEGVDERREPDGKAPRVATAESVLDRRADVENRLAIELIGRSGADRDDPPSPEITGRGERRRVALRPDFAELGERGQLAAGASIQLTERAVEGRITHDRDGEDVRLDVPGLVRDHAQLHGGHSLR
jgi:hypothetical protein